MTSKKTIPPRQTTRCAIYTRKSTEEGLQQDFNTLDAQRESAEAYILAHKHEGWMCLPDRYDDGGYTGGNLDRPAFKRLMSDVETGRIDAIVVYKIDRLSLMATLEEVCGVKIFHLDFEPSGTAASAVSETFGAAVLLNSNNARWRRNHDLAHELFHLLTWSIFHPTAEAALIAGEAEEKLATCFARHLLMPTDPFRTAINSRMRDGKVSFESLFDVAREFDVSVESVLWQMHFLYGRGPAGADQTKQDIEKAKLLAPLLEDREDQKPHPWPARYHALAVKAIRRGELAIGRFAEYLNITRHEAMRFVEQEIPDGEEVQVTPA